MKFKEFRKTPFYKEADICEYYDTEGNRIDLPYRKLQNKEVHKWRWKLTPPLNTLVIYLGS